jgi:SRSO17 transposase
MTSQQIESLAAALAAHVQRFKHCFSREPTFQHLGQYVQGLLTNLDRKSIEPIALGAAVPPRTLQEFLSHLSWDHERAEATLHRLVADRPVRGVRIGVLDASGYPKQGEKTPGVHHQWCGQLAKVTNCVVGQHLLWTDNDPTNPFSCMLCSDLFLPETWAADRPRCRRAHLPEELGHRTKWQIGLEQLERAMGHGVIFDWVTFDADYGDASKLWFELDRLGLWGIGEVRPTFRCWTTRPACTSLQAPHAATQRWIVKAQVRHDRSSSLEVLDRGRCPEDVVALPAPIGPDH